MAHAAMIPRALSALGCAACAACGAQVHRGAASSDPIAARFPLALVDDRALCDQLLARDAAAYGVMVDSEPRLRRTVVVSDLHLGPGTSDPRFAGIEDFYVEPEWHAFLERQAAAGPTDLVIAGDFIEFWQIAAALHALPERTAALQPGAGPILAADQSFSVVAAKLVIDAHRSVFRDLGTFLAAGDHRVILLAGNHDADLLWPKVQLHVARAIAPADPSRLLFVAAAAYEHGGIHVEHGHAYDAANRYAANHAPFGRDRNGACRLQSSWGEVFVDKFYTETERQVPFIDNLYPESAAIVWAMRDNPDLERDLGAVIRFVELIHTAETGQFNRGAANAVLQSVLGTATAPESAREVLEHLLERLGRGDGGARAIVGGLSRLATDPELGGLWGAIRRAAAAMPDVGAAFDALKSIDPTALGHLREVLLGKSLENAALEILAAHPELSIVVLGHTHEVGGSLTKLEVRGRTGYYANSGSWLPVASIAELRAKGITWDKLSLADRAMFPSKMTAVIIEYAGGAPRPPVVLSAGAVTPFKPDAPRAPAPRADGR
jgi:UDP-2,3-diacylglucosamine pyrophosphatase LpxH